MAPELPGYFFDAEKNKYFKIVKPHNASPSVTWTPEAVKKRRAEDRSIQAARKWSKLVKNHIKRHGLRRAAVSGGLLARESGLPPRAEQGWGKADHVDIAAAAWAGGLQAKGAVPFAPSFARARYANMPCFYVGGDDEKTGLGVAYATLDEETLVGSYIPTDSNDRIHFDRNATYGSGRALSFRTEMVRCPQMSSIKYHSNSHKVLLTSREPDHSCALYFFSPPLTAPNDERPQWLLGETDQYKRVSIRYRHRDEWLVHQCTPAPPSSDLICAIGTNAGLLKVSSDGTTENMTWIGQRELKSQAAPREIFDQDFQHGNPNVLLAGGRQPRLWITDLRTPVADWSYIRHASSINHLRSVNPNQVLAAGLENSMALYDMRFFSKRPNGTTPLLRFPSYRNAAHLHTGWDVSPDLGVVAAAQDDGRMALFSLRSGSKLCCRALDEVRTETPVKAVLFQGMPRERMPSLFLGEGTSLRKFSFGSLESDDEE